MSQMTGDLGRTALAGGLARLPSGRHRLKPEDVLASQRGRLVVAFFEAIAEKGYAATTIAEVVTRAGVSRRTFYEQFASKEACYLAAFDECAQIVVDTMNSARDEVPTGWRGYVEASLRAYLALLAAYPTLAHGFHVETLNAGPALYQRRTQMTAILARRMADAYMLARHETPALPELPAELFDLLIGGIDDRIRHCLLTRGAAALPDLLALLVRATFAVFGVAK